MLTAILNWVAVFTLKNKMKVRFYIMYEILNEIARLMRDDRDENKEKNLTLEINFDSDFSVKIRIESKSLSGIETVLATTINFLEPQAFVETQLSKIKDIIETLSVN